MFFAAGAQRPAPSGRHRRAAPSGCPPARHHAAARRHYAPRAARLQAFVLFSSALPLRIAGGFPRGLKYVRGILKQVGHISNYVRPVFSLLPCGHNAPETSFRFSPARYAVSRPLFPRRTCPPRSLPCGGAGHGHKARATAIQRIYCRHAETAKTLPLSKNR